MNRFDIQRLRDLPIEGVAERMGLTVTRHKALCPFHNDSHPSLSFHARRNTYKCFVCDAHGGVIDLAMHLLGKDFREACHWLAEEHSVIVSEACERGTKAHCGTQECTAPFDASRYARYFNRPFLNTPARAFLFKERRLDARVVRWCRLTSWTDRHGTSWLQIPYFDVEGSLIGVQNRRLTTTAPQFQTPRFMFPRGSKCKIYNLPILKTLAQDEELWIAEGCSDCWSLMSSGRKAIAIPSATLLNPNDLTCLKDRNLHMAPDNDEPGERLCQQLTNLFPQLVRHTLPQGCKDFSEWYMLRVKG